PCEYSSSPALYVSEGSSRSSFPRSPGRNRTTSANLPGLVPLPIPEPDARLQTLCTEHVLYVCLSTKGGTPAGQRFLLVSPAGRFGPANTRELSHRFVPHQSNPRRTYT